MSFRDLFQDSEESIVWKNPIVNNLTVKGTISGPSVGNVLTSTTLTTDSIIKGNGSHSITTSGILIDSSNNLIFNSPSNIYMYLDSPYVFVQDSLYSPNAELGLRFTISSSVTVSRLKIYSTTNMSNNRTLRLWDETGILIATATTVDEAPNAWNISGPLNTGDLLLSPGTYTISFTLDNVFGYHSRKSVV